jgi:hypothetical protein
LEFLLTNTDIVISVFLFAAKIGEKQYLTFFPIKL